MFKTMKNIWLFREKTSTVAKQESSVDVSDS